MTTEGSLLNNGGRLPAIYFRYLSANMASALPVDRYGVLIEHYVCRMKNYQRLAVRVNNFRKALGADMNNEEGRDFLPLTYDVNTSVMLKQKAS